MKVPSVVIALATIMFAVHSSLAFAQQQSADEQAVWKLEQAYWNYVKALDLESYRNLWNTHFVGWPLSSSKPVRKDHITDWITLYKDKGLQLKSFTLEPTASQAVENLVITHYLLTSLWEDNLGHGEPQTLRITHTWIRTPD